MNLKNDSHNNSNNSLKSAKKNANKKYSDGNLYLYQIIIIKYIDTNGGKGILSYEEQQSNKKSHLSTTVASSSDQPRSPNGGICVGGINVMTQSTNGDDQSTLESNRHTHHLPDQQ